MFSLDVVRWRDKQQQQQLHQPNQLDATRPPSRELRQSRLEARDSDDGDEVTLPDVHQTAQIQRDRRMKKLYGRTQKEMHDAYVERVGQWMQMAPTATWAKDYAKQTSASKEYVPRERTKAKELGASVLTTNVYAPRAVYKGGGECVRSLIDADPSTPPDARDAYREAIRFIEKTRAKDKEIQPPLSVPKNKSLECAHYFVDDILNTTTTTSPHSTPSSRTPLNPLDQSDRDHHHVQPSPTTAEYVAHPQWRAHRPERWMGHAFVPTVASTTAHTAQHRSITGDPYAPSVLTAEAFVPPHKRHLLPPKDAALDPRDHDRRAQTAAAMLRATRSPRRHDRKYFRSMWMTDTTGSRAVASPMDPTMNAGRALTLQLREHANSNTRSPRRSPTKTQPRHAVRVRPLDASSCSSTAASAVGPGST